MSELAITPTTRVGALLSAYPALEPVLIDFAPEFAKLRNPVLRRTVAKVATLAQAARIARVDVRDLVLALRREVGQGSAGGEEIPPDAASADGNDQERPEWTRDRRTVESIEADRIQATGSHPAATVERRARELGADELVLVRSSFVPAPLIDLLRQQGFAVHTRAVGPQEYETRIGKP